MLLVNEAKVHGPDRLDIIIDKLSQRVLHRHGILGNGPLPMPGQERSK